ncbi:MAG: PilZ domain-containing protein [Pseudomonadota bacterium]
MSKQHNRDFERVRTLRSARIVWDNAQRTINCTIRDMSRGGARIELTDMTALPETFDLQLPPAKELRPVQVVRRSGRVMGVMFLDATLSSPGSDESPHGMGVEAYDPRDGNLPGFQPMPSLIREALPWATPGAYDPAARVVTS